MNEAYRNQTEQNIRTREKARQKENEEEEKKKNNNWTNCIS